MRATRFLLMCAGALAAAGCDESGADAILAPQVPLAYVRFVNAVPDTGATDWRFIDQLEYSPEWFGLAFRGFTPYRGAKAGSRQLRVFPSSADINITSSHFLDETVVLEAGTYYTLVHAGNSRTGQPNPDKLIVIKDDIPTVAAGTIALRTMNMGTGLGNADMFATATSGEALPAAPLFGGVAYGASSGYSTRAPGAFVLRATPAGTTTVLATGTAPVGLAGDPANLVTVIGGSNFAGSAMVGILMPRSVAGSSAPQTAVFTNPAMVYIIDRHPK